MTEKEDEFLEEIPVPIGNWILNHMKGAATPNGQVYHYAEVCTALKEYAGEKCSCVHLRKTDNPHLAGAESIHHWFGLTYASYLVLPRVSLQTMPAEWQEKFVTLLQEMSDTVETEPEGGNYFVYVRNGKGQFISDPFSQYRHKKAPLK